MADFSDSEFPRLPGVDGKTNLGHDLGPRKERVRRQGGLCKSTEKRITTTKSIRTIASRILLCILTSFL